METENIVIDLHTTSGIIVLRNIIVKHLFSIWNTFSSHYRFVLLTHVEGLYSV